MPYRDYQGALLRRRREVMAEIRRLDAELARFERRIERRVQLTAELGDLDGRIVSRNALRNDRPVRTLRSRLGLAAAAIAAWGAVVGGAAASIPEAERPPLLMVKSVGSLVGHAGEPDEPREMRGLCSALERYSSQTPRHTGAPGQLGVEQAGSDRGRTKIGFTNARCRSTIFR